MNLDIQNDDYKDNFKILLYKQKGQTNFSLEERKILLSLYQGSHIKFPNKLVRTNIYLKNGVKFKILYCVNLCKNP